MQLTATLHSASPKAQARYSWAWQPPPMAKSQVVRQPIMIRVRSPTDCAFGHLDAIRVVDRPYNECYTRAAGNNVIEECIDVHCACEMKLGSRERRHTKGDGGIDTLKQQNAEKQASKKQLHVDGWGRSCCYNKLGETSKPDIFRFGSFRTLDTVEVSEYADKVRPAETDQSQQTQDRPKM